MKLFLVFAFVLVYSMAEGQNFPTKKCSEGEHSVLYCPRKAEPTCDNPTIHDMKTAAACGVPDCFCDTPTVRDTCTGKCVNLKDCPKK